MLRGRGHPMKPLFVCGALAAILLSAATISLSAQNAYDYHRGASEIVWRGTQALKLCNGLFVSNRTIDQIYAQELGGLGTPIARARVDIDAARKTVAIGVGGTNDPVPVMRSALREGIGCVVMSPDQTFADIDKLPRLDMPPLPAAPPSMPWPDGDRIDKTALPRGIDEPALQRAGNW